MLEEIIAEIKCNVSNKHIFIERIKGYVSLEEDPSVDYILDCVFDDISLKSLKNENNWLAPEQKGFLVFGRNISSKNFWNVLNAFRT